MILQEAIKLNKLGFKVIPTTHPKDKDGKRPLCSWKKYQERQTTEDVKEIFNKSNVGGMALITGNGIEVIDIDLKYSIQDNFLQLFFDALIDAIGMDCFESLILSKTVSNGYHLIYKTNVSEGNQKLASRYTEDHEKKNEHDKVRVLLETRGEGGYILIPPTEGYEYDNPFNDILNLPELTDTQRNAIINVCKSFDETNEIYKKKAAIPVEIGGTNKTTIEAFNESHTPIEFLEAAGWQFKYSRGDNDYYVRAGKDLREGIGGGYSNKLGLFYVFTSSTQFEPNKAYNAFQVYAYLEHGGDFKTAAKDLYRKNYGDRITKNVDTHKAKLELISEGTEEAKEQIQDTKILDKIWSERFDINVKPVEKPSTLFVWDSFKQDWTGMCGDGEIITFLGASKSRKSAIASMACATGLNGGLDEVLMFKGDFEGRNIIHLDTEQGATDYHNMVKEMFWQANIPSGTNPKNFYSFRLTEYSLEQKVSFLDYVIHKVGNVGYVFLDGIVDLCQDFNDLKESKMLVSYVRQLAAKHRFSLANVLHNAKSTGLARGHLGSFLEEKSKCLMNCIKDKDMGHTTFDFTHTRGFTPPPSIMVEHDDNGHLHYLK